MSTDRDVDRIVRSWLEEGVTSLPDRVLDDVLGQLPATPQRRSRWPARRLNTMTTPIKFAAAAAAIGVLAVVVGIAPGTGGPGVSNQAASPSPTPSAVPLGGYAPDLAPGTYVQPIWDGPGHWTVTVPEGWEVFYSMLWKNVDGKSDPDSVGGPGAVTLSWEEAPVNVVADPCHWKDSLADPPVGPTVDDLANAFAEQVGSDPSGPTDVTLGGYPAKRIELTAPADLDMATCDEAAYSVWGGDALVTADVAGEVTVLYILDVEGVRLPYVMRAWHRPDASAEDLAELEAMLASSRIDLPAPSPAASGSPAARAWSPSSLEQDWPAPVRAEPAGEPVIVPLSPAWYVDPASDTGSDASPWIDIVRVRGQYVELAEPIPTPGKDPAERWIAYGLVLDIDDDGIPDVRVGIDNMPLATGGHRAWRTDLHTGRTESTAGSPYGMVGDSYFDTFYPGEDLPRGAPVGSARFSLDEGAYRFYAWASVIEDGRIVGTDYAPDSGWLDETTP